MYLVKSKTENEDLADIVWAQGIDEVFLALKREGNDLSMFIF